MSYPSKLKLFRAWSKAMMEGATVDKPDYSKNGKTTASRPKRRRRRRKKKKKED